MWSNLARLDYDLATGAITLGCDVSGQLALRYARIGATVYVASHDIALAPFVPLEVDETTRASIRDAGWSVGGFSLIRGIEVCRGGETVTLRDDVVRTGPDYPPETCPETAMLDYLGARMPAGTVTVELSAGFDSRAALAATLACKETHEIAAFSEGPADSLDVTVAREICRRYGISFEHRLTPPADTAFILDSWSRTAASSNGHIDISILASRQPSCGTTICGDGGEIHRGYYYPYTPFQRLIDRDGAATEARAAIGRKLPGGDRLDAAVSRLAAPGTSGREVMDRFYIAERFGIWNQKLTRDGEARISPFYARRAMGRLGQGLWSRPHVNLIARHLAKAADLPINGEAAPASYAGGLLRTGWLETGVLLGKIRRRLRRRADLQDSRADVMSTLIRGLPAGFLHHPAQSWTDYGASRFLSLYAEAASSSGAAAQPAPVTQGLPGQSH
ncbi:MAG: hypothetical protein AAF317_20945 [Pseudomonadota bacterium]